jgi:hypothetical protein
VTRRPWRVALHAWLTRFRPTDRWWLGTPYRVVIVPAACGGYTLMIVCPQGVDWVDLPLRDDDYDHPDDREFTAASAALAARGLVWVLPWQLDEHGNLTAPVVASSQHNPVAEPGTTNGTEDRS